MAHRPAKRCSRCGTLVKASESRCKPCGGTPFASAKASYSKMPRNMREAVLARDGHQCTAHTDSGRCPMTTTLEADHITPVSRGGTHTMDNARTLCRQHHLSVTGEMFGRGKTA